MKAINSWLCHSGNFSYSTLFLVLMFWFLLIPMYFDVTEICIIAEFGPLRLYLDDIRLLVLKEYWHQYLS